MNYDKNKGARVIQLRQGECYYISPTKDYYSSHQYNYLICLANTPLFDSESEPTVTNYAVVCAELTENKKYTFVGLGDYEKELFGDVLLQAFKEGKYKPNTWVYLVINNDNLEFVNNGYHIH